MLSLSKVAVRAALKPTAVQEFRNHFWEAVAARSLKRNDGSAEGTNAATIVDPKCSIDTILLPTDEDANAGMLRRRAREHFRMSAASRAMKRGDGVMSKYFSFNNNDYHGGSIGGGAFNPELPSLIDIATTTKAREDMHTHFWTAHQARKDARDAKKQLHLINKLPAFNRAQHTHEHRFTLPTTLSEAYIEFGSMKHTKHRPRPLAITEIKPPFKIVDVNKAWCKLCGYSHDEAVGSTLQQLLQGPNTNTTVAKNLITSLQHENEEHEAVLINYRSDGRQFKNHARVGRIKNEEGETTHFVGVFKRLSDDDEELYANA